MKWVSWGNDAAGDRREIAFLGGFTMIKLYRFLTLVIIVSTLVGACGTRNVSTPSHVTEHPSATNPDFSPVCRRIHSLSMSELASWFGWT